jgi:hypothetical protein
MVVVVEPQTHAKRFSKDCLWIGIEMNMVFRCYICSKSRLFVLRVACHCIKA